jgi:hypothetical protein
VSGHVCPHPDCSTVVDAGLFCCRRHWYTLPRWLRSEIWSNYRSGYVHRIMDGYAKADTFWRMST